MEVVCIPLVSSLSSLRKNDSNDEAVKTESLSEDQDKDHTNEDVFLSIGTDTSITDNTNSEASSQGGEADAQAGGQKFVSTLSLESITGVSSCAIAAGTNATVEDNTDDKAVDTENTSHNNGDKGLVNEVWLEDTNGADTNTGLGSTVSGTQVYRISQNVKDYSEKR